MSKYRIINETVYEKFKVLTREIIRPETKDSKKKGGKKKTVEKFQTTHEKLVEE